MYEVSTCTENTVKKWVDLIQRLLSQLQSGFIQVVSWFRGTSRFPLTTELPSVCYTMIYMVRVGLGLG